MIVSLSRVGTAGSASSLSGTSDIITREVLFSIVADSRTHSVFAFFLSTEELYYLITYNFTTNSKLLFSMCLFSLVQSPYRPIPETLYGSQE